MELLKKTNKVEGKLIDIICSLNLEVSGNNKLVPKIRKQQELVEEHLLQTENPPSTGSETVFASTFQAEQQQQLDICGQVKVAADQRKVTSASVNLPTDSMQLVGKQEIELPSLKRPPQLERRTLEKLFEKPSKKLKLCDQQEVPKSQPRLMAISTCDSPHDENGNAQLVIQRIDTIQEDNSLTTGPNFKFSGEMAISGTEMEKSNLNVCVDSEQLKKYELCGPKRLLESQLVTSSLSVPRELLELNLEHQQQTSFSSKEKKSEFKVAFVLASFDFFDSCYLLARLT